MSARILVYGATGFSGLALADRLVRDGHQVMLAGRNAAKLAALGQERRLETRAFAVENVAAATAALADIDLVYHCAGNFQVTARPMMLAAIASRTDYMDLSGEWPTFAEAMALGDKAAAAGVMLFPGAGFAIAGTDCLLALAARVPGTVRLRIACSSPHRISRGSFRTMMNLSDGDIRVRRGGEVVAVPVGSLIREFDFGRGYSETQAVTFPDIVTGEFSTGIGDIEAYFECNRIVGMAWPVARWVKPVRDVPLYRAAVAGAVALWPETPPPEVLAKASYVLVAESVDRWRRITAHRLRTLDGYGSTTIIAGAIAARWAAGTRVAGFTTPSRLLGAEFILTAGCATLETPLPAATMGEAAHG